jgi:hypothetical protein
MPHPKQLSEAPELNSMHCPAQQVPKPPPSVAQASPLAPQGGTWLQRPPRQLSPLAHALPQDPQLAGSLMKSLQLPPQQYVT